MKTIKFDTGGQGAAAESPDGFDVNLFLIVMALTCIGVIMVFSSSGSLSNIKWKDGAHFLKKEAAFVGASLVFMWFMANFDYRYLRRPNVKRFVGGIAVFFLLLVLMPGVGVSVNGATRWIDIGFFRFQPSEPAKIAMIVLTAAFLADSGSKILRFDFFIRAAFIGGAFCALILAERDFGLCMVNFLICYAMLIVAGARFSHLGMLGAGAVAAATPFLCMDPMRMRRLFAFVNPWADAQGAGFQIIQSLIAVASGGWIGRGLGMGQQKRFYLPEQHTDFIFSVFMEECGVIGMAVLLLAFAYLAYRGATIALNATDRFGMLLAFGITFSIAIQAFINMGVATGLLPVTGMTLPFLSYGGSSLISTFIGVGILLNISMNRGPRRRTGHENA